MVEAPITRNARVPRQLSWHGGVGYAPNWVSFGLCLWLTTSCGCGLTKCWKEGCEAVADCRELSQQGVEALEREDWQTAESSFSQAIQICPIDPIARRNYCEVLWKRGDRPAALNQLHEAIALRSSDPALHLRLAELSLEMADYDTCYREVNEAIDLEPTLAEAWLLRGKLMWRSGRLNQSMTDLHRALKYDPEQRDTLYLLAEVHRGLNQPQQALNVLYQLAEIYPPAWPTWHLNATQKLNQLLRSLLVAGQNLQNYFTTWPNPNSVAVAPISLANPSSVHWKLLPNTIPANKCNRKSISPCKLPLVLFAANPIGRQ